MSNQNHIETESKGTDPSQDEVLMSYYQKKKIDFQLTSTKIPEIANTPELFSRIFFVSETCLLLVFSHNQKK